LNTWSNRVHIERDAKNKHHEQQLFQQIASIIHQNKPVTTVAKQMVVQHVDMEQAMRELAELEKNII